MTLRKHRSTVWEWLLCPYIQLTGFIISVVQFNTHTTLYALECYIPSLKLGSDIQYIVHALFILLVYICISYVTYKQISPRFCIVSGCASLAVVSVLMGSNIFTSNFIEFPTNMQGNFSAEGNPNNYSSFCDSYKKFSPVEEKDLSLSWQLLGHPLLLAAILAQFLAVYGVAVHFVSGLILVERTSEGDRTSIVLAFLLIAQHSAPYFGSIFNPLVTVGVDSSVAVDSSESDWASLLTQGWVPLGATLLFLTPFALRLVTPSPPLPEQSELSNQVTSSDTVCHSSGTDDAVHDGNEANEKRQDVEECENDFFQSAAELLSTPIVLCNFLSQVFISAGLTGVDEIQNKMTTLVRNIGNIAEGGKSGREYWIQYSAHVNNWGPAFTLFLTGWLLFKRRPEPRRLTLWTAMTLLWMMIFVLMFTRDANPSGNGNFKFSLSPGPRECQCEAVLNQGSLSPICSVEKTNYPSSCYAGCREVCSSPNRTQYFTNCSALSSNSSILGSDHCGSDSGLDQLVWFLYIFIVIKSLVSTGRLIGVFISIRCVSDEDKPLSLALTTGFTSLISMLDRKNFYARYITELTGIAILFTSLVWYLIQNQPLYASTSQCLHNSRSRKNKGPSVNAGGTGAPSRHENSTLLPRESIVDETELLDVKIMSRQRDSIDVTKSKRLWSGKRFSLDYRKQSMSNFEEQVVYP